MKQRSLISMFALSFCTTSTAFAQIEVLNDTFELPVYDSFSFNDADSPFGNPDDVSFEESIVSSASGGNPGAFGTVSHVHDVDRDEEGDPINGDGFTSLQSFYTELTTTYTPSDDGAILSIDYSLDIRTSDTSFVSLFFELSDPSGGSVVFGDEGGFLTIVSDGQWDTYTVSNIIQSGASARDFSGTNPLSFGFGFTSDEDVSFGELTASLDVDNFIVTVTQVPEPASFVAVSAGLSLMLRRRRSA